MTARATVRQVVTVAEGFAYGTIGADIHVTADQQPLYLLRAWRPARRLDDQWLRAVPSRLLNAAFGVVGFTARDTELAGLRRWLSTGDRLGVRWLYGPGGTGKSRLADQLAADAAAGGWKVITAVHGAAAVIPPPGSQDLRPADAPGILLIADYADRWPLSDLSWLLANSVLHRDARPVRVLLIGRTDGIWPAVQATAADLHPTCTVQAVDLLDSVASRRAMFVAGRDAFASIYQLDSSQMPEPMALGHADLGLILSLHVAALVAVDAAARNRTAPADLAAMSSYLLDREQRHWQDRYEQRAADPGPDAYRTPAPQMNRAVFTAALTGPVTPTTAEAALTTDGLATPADVLRDHARIYPALTPGDRSALEPLYPDRLAEDFIALTVPGHDAEYPAQTWSPKTATATATAELSEPVTRRTAVFLVAAAARWEHLGRTLVHPLLHARPDLALAGGSATLTALAQTPYVDLELLERVESSFPDDRHLDLDAGIAAVTERVAEYQLRQAGPAEQVEIRRRLAKRLAFAGRFSDAHTIMAEAVHDTRVLLDHAPNPAPAADLALLAVTLTELSLRLWENDDPAEALVVADEACMLYDEPLADGEYAASAARCYANRSVYLSALGRAEEALRDSTQAVELARRVATTGDPAAESELARAMANHGVYLNAVGRTESALAASEDALAVRQKQAARAWDTYAPDLAVCWINVAAYQSYLMHNAEAVVSAQQGVGIYRTVVERNPEPFQRRLAGALLMLADCQDRAGDKATARINALEAVGAFRRLAETNPAVHSGSLAGALTNLANISGELARWDEALRAQQEAVSIRRHLATIAPELHESALASELIRLGRRLQDVDRHDDALQVQEEGLALRHRIYARSPSTEANELANTLFQLSTQYGSLGRWADARTANEEALALLPQIPELSRTAWLYRTANLTHNLSIWLDKLGLEADATRRTEEAVTLFRELIELEPAGNETHLASGLSELGIRLGQRDPERALASEQEALEIRRRLHAENPAAYQKDLGTSLNNLSGRLAAVGRHTEALEAIDEALLIARRLASVNPAYREDVVRRVSTRGVRLAALGRHQEAIQAEEEALPLRRTLAAERPSVHRAGLMVSLHRYAEYLDAAGRPAEAAQVRREVAASQ